MGGISSSRKWFKYLKYEIWRIPVSQLPKWKATIIKFLRVVLLAVRGFGEDRIQLRASALTLYTLLSIIPFIAIAFGLAQGFGFKENLTMTIKNNLAAQQEVANWLIEIAESLLENTKAGFIAGIAIFVLIIAVMKVMNDIENMFNHIWQIKKPRSIIRKFTDYFTLIIIAPTLVIFSGSASVYIVSQVRDLIWSSEFMNFINPFFTFLITLMPYAIISLLFSLFYTIMPNTRVKFRSAIIAGLFSGIIFQLTQYLFIEMQIGVSRISALYGGFAAFPLFLIWIQISWIIILFGAELSYSSQNADYHEFEYDLKNISPSYRKLIALLLVNKMVKQFAHGKMPLKAPDLSIMLEVPIRMVRELLNELVKCQLIMEADTDGKNETYYLPAIDINKMSISFVLERIEKKGSDQITIKEDETYQQIKSRLEKLKENIQDSDANSLLKDI